MELSVECNKRPEGSKPNALRRDGKIPAVLYGHNGTESVPLTIDAKTAKTLLKKASLNNTLIQLSVPELPWSGKTLLKEVQTHPWKPDLYHLSFFSVAQHGSLSITVPLHCVGESAGVKTNGGTLDQVLTELEVQCSASDIPDAIEVDISNLSIGDALHVNELTFPAGVEPVGEGDRVVVSILQGRTATSSEESESVLSVE